MFMVSIYLQDYLLNLKFGVVLSQPLIITLYQGVKVLGCVNRLELLWNEFDNHGYMTLYAEDHPTTNTFNERFHGFEIPPTAHYMRPFWLAAEHSKQSHCLGMM